GAQVDRAAAGWSADDAECGAEDISVGETPSRMIQHVVETGKHLQSSALFDLEGLGHRNVPLKRIPVSQEQQLAKLTRSSVPKQERRIGAAVRADQPGINGEPLQIRGSRPADKPSPRRIEHSLNHIERDSWRENDTARCRVVRTASARIVAVHCLETTR